MNPNHMKTNNKGYSPRGDKGNVFSLNKVRGFRAVALGLSAMLSLANAQEPVDKNATVDDVDTFVRTNLSDLESKVRSTLMFGGSAPVSFMGEARLHMQNFELNEYPDWMKSDRTWTSTNWEGNASLLRIGMVAKPGRSAVLWAKIGFQHTLPGFYTNGSSTAPYGYEQASSRHDKSDEQISIHEDMSAGLAIRTKPASFWLKMGNVMWTEAGPLTIWKSQPRTFAWDYLPFEVEQPIQRYYEYNIVKGEKSGRAAWNKKPFNGIQLESIDLPGNLYFNFVYGTFERYDNNELDYFDFSGDVGYSELANEAKSRGNGDRYRHMIHSRLAYKNPENNTVLGLNFVKTIYKDDIFANEAWSSKFNAYDEVLNIDSTSSAYGKLTTNRHKEFYKTFTVGSVDYNYEIDEKSSIFGDIGFSMKDSVFAYSYFKDQVVYSEADADSIVENSLSSTRLKAKRGNPKFAAFASIESEHLTRMKLDLVYVHPKFYSPFSFVAPNDAFYAFGSNMVGAGKFIGRGEGSPYVQNMTGALLTINPDIGYGHLRFAYGYHFQIEESRDFLYMPYRLQGSDLYSFYQTHYTRWGNNFVYSSDPTIAGQYYRHLGDETYKIGGRDKGAPIYTATAQNQFSPLGSGPNSGGITSDFLGMYEGFMAYDSKAEAQAVVEETTGLYGESKTIPRNKKSTFNLEVDAAYDIAPYIGSPKDVLLGLYGSLSGVNKGHAPFKIGDDAMLWSYYVRVEPAVAVSNTFYILGLFGFENWKSSKSYMWIPTLFTREAPVKPKVADYTGGVADPDYVADLAAYDLEDEDFRKDQKEYKDNPKRWGKTLNVPIDYRDLALGVGFDWDFSPRVGLHGRFKWFKRIDEGLNAKLDEIEKILKDNNSPLNTPNNDFSGWLVSGEIKMWF